MRPAQPGCLRILAACIAAAAAVAFPAANAQLSQDDSVIADVRLAARGGDYSTAFERIDRIYKAGLKSKAHAALASEYETEGQTDLAREQFVISATIVQEADMPSLDRISAYAFLAVEMASLSSYVDDAFISLDTGIELAEDLSGIAQDLAYAELAFASLQTTGELAEAERLASRIKDKQLSDKIIAQLQTSY